MSHSVFSSICAGLIMLASAIDASGAGSARVLYDQAHGQSPVQPQLSDAASKAGVEIVPSSVPLDESSLKGADILYLRAPSQAFAAAEKEAIVAFVRRGGSLFLAFDEERRISLGGTGVNDLIAPFGLQLTPDYKAPHNTGAIARAGEVHRADREIPYSGGRAVEGGTPFSFVLDEAGKPAAAHGAYAKLDSGARVVVLGDAMVTLFLGGPDGERLQGTTVQDTRYWGKDSAVFMEEVLAWLAKKK